MIMYEQNPLVLNSSLWDKSQDCFIALVYYIILTPLCIRPSLAGLPGPDDYLTLYFNLSVVIPWLISHLLDLERLKIIEK